LVRAAPDADPDVQHPGASNGQAQSGLESRTRRNMDNAIGNACLNSANQ
jgi:hypothetical protein